jgi:hypothetical protein
VTDHRRQGDILVVRFTTTLSLSEAAQLVVEDLPRAGFVLRRGDAEGDEIDQPFTGPGYRGALKLHGLTECRTEGTLVGTRAP